MKPFQYSIATLMVATVVVAFATNWVPDETSSTNLTEADVLGQASEFIEDSYPRIDGSMYEHYKTVFDEINREWRLYYEQVPGSPGGYFGIVICDETGDLTLVPGI